MIKIGYISELGLIRLGNQERFYLSLIGMVDCSAYFIYSQLNKIDKPIAYKNVHKTIAKLKKHNLIELVAGNFSRNAKLYKLTQQGVFQVLLTSEVTIPFLIKNKDDPILKIILYQFFEVSTIEYFDTIPREYFISEYLNRCCEEIIHQVQKGSKFREESRKLLSIEDEANYIAKREIKHFIYNIVTMSNISRMRFTYETGSKTTRFDFVIADDEGYPHNSYKDFFKEVRELRAKDPDYSSLFPNRILIKDKKFMYMFTEMKNEFEKGCKEFI